MRLSFGWKGRLRREPEIWCVFPECATYWVFDPRIEEQELAQFRAEQGWRYLHAVETSLGTAWGWACSDSSHHFEIVDGQSRPFAHPDNVAAGDPI